MSDDKKESSEEQALVSVGEELATAAMLYGGEKAVSELFHIVRKVAPWASPKAPFPMQDTEVGYCIRRSLAMGLDPLNPHEVQIWKDKHGIQFQLAYTIMTEWVKRFKGQHTEPLYTRLTDSDKEFELMDPTDEAYYCEFIMHEDFDQIERMIDKMRFDPLEARSHFTVRGIGSARKEEYASPYFAPNGRSRAWKLKKRALVDAYRLKFGTPTRPEIMELRRLSGFSDVTIHDWKVAVDSITNTEGGSAEDALELARAAAEKRKAPPLGDTAEEVVENGNQVLNGVVLEEWEPPAVEQREERPQEQIRADLRAAAGWDGAKRRPADEQEPPSQAQVDILSDLLRQVLPPPWEDRAKVITEYIWGRKLYTSLDLREVAAYIKWLQNDPGTRADTVAAREAFAVYAAAVGD